MDNQEKKRIKPIIEKKINQLKKDIQELQEMTKPIGPENSIGRVSRMDAINNKSINEAALRKREEKLIQLEKALKNIDEDSFGYCNKCGNEIQKKRMEIMPESIICVSCLNKK